METIVFEVDEEIKDDFENICNQLGVSTSTMLTLFVEKVANEQQIPFEVSIDPFYSRENQERLIESVNQLKEGQIISKTMEELIQTEN